MKAVLAIFEGLAIFRVYGRDASAIHAGDLFRLRKGCRIHDKDGLQS
jgi:hypothetical protein